MKRLGTILAVLLLLVLLPAAALAEDISLFKKINPRSGLTLPVYSAPSTSAWRGANGKAEASTKGTIYAVGWEGDWLLMMYGTSGGATRVGYTPRSALKGREPDLPDLDFEFRDASITSSCTMTDDTKKGKNSITTLFSGTKVTYLASFTDTSSNGDGVTKAYIETTVDGKTARGFVPMSCVKVSQSSSIPGIIVPTPTPSPSPYKPDGLHLPCYHCHGLGHVETSCLYCIGGRNTCVSCGGRGNRTCGGCGGRGFNACRTCGGSGRDYKGRNCSSCIGGSRTCSVCYGSGSRFCASCGGRGSSDCPICIGGQVTQLCGFCGGRGHQ